MMDPEGFGDSDVRDPGSRPAFGASFTISPPVKGPTTLRAAALTDRPPVAALKLAAYGGEVRARLLCGRRMAEGTWKTG